MIIQVNPPKNVTLVPAVAAVTEVVSEVELVTLQDDGEQVKAVITISGYDKVLILWEGAAYIAIGDWTQAQANARIIELLN